MRFFAIFPALCALAALVLSLLCLFAGSSPGFLQNADLATVNISRIGQTDLFNTSDGNGGLLSDLGNAIQGGINDITGDAVDDITNAIGVHDFYKAHVLNFCEGFYRPNDTAANPRQNVTHCSKRNALFHFDLNNILEDELANGATLADLRWPDQIEDGLRMLRIASRAMFVFYCIAIAFTGIAVLTSFVGVLGGGRLSALGNFGIFILAFLTLVIASIISTVIAAKLSSTINKYGHDIGVAAYRGDLFIGMTWAAVGVLLLGAVAWIFECVVGRRRSKTYTEKP